MYLEKIEKLVDKDYSKATYTKYARTCRYVEAFIKNQMDAVDCPVTFVTLMFIQNFEVWLKTDKDCSHNTSMKYLSIFSMIIKHCYDNDWISKNTFAKFPIGFDGCDPGIFTVS